ncbi:hypothetical protein L6452_01739 [Arctium lappa]|uniref:Uncharacterized protein n=1 Tax=Arctium lappa TaxID=4217 RepID=A0ACB9FHK8_ARCLA|nr:hypothetical protein L6452_01739 [Arctium lappa]
MAGQGTQDHAIAQMSMDFFAARNRINALDEQNWKAAEELLFLRNQNTGTSLDRSLVKEYPADISKADVGYRRCNLLHSDNSDVATTNDNLYMDLMKYPPEKFEDVRARTLAYMRVEDDMAFRRKQSSHNKSRSFKKLDFKTRSTSKVEPSKQISNWPPKNEKVDAIKDKSKWCDFHGNNGHVTDDYIALRQELDCAIKAIGIDKSEIVRRSIVLIGFNGDMANTIGEITLLVYAKEINKQTKFNVIDCSSSYNVIMGRPWIHDMKVVPSMYHQTIKFPTSFGRP